MLPYFPALRFKQGEYSAGSKIARDIQAHIRPRFVIPPPKELDPEKGKTLSADEIAYLTGERIGKHWPLHTAFLDAQFVAPLLGDDGVRTLFRRAQARNEKLVAVATIDCLFNPVYREFLRPSGIKVGIYVPYEQVDTSVLIEGIKAIGCVPKDCVLFLDFTGAPLEVEGTSSSVAGLFDELGSAARWHRIVFQGSAFPPTNPAESGDQVSIPRHEWSAFFAALEETTISPEVIGYGDFGADCGEINFPRSGGGAPIRHIRYTTPRSTLVVRGKSTGTQAEVMKDVCQRILDCGHYAGQTFSYADDLIWLMAKATTSGGTPSMWREWNTAHHITRVVHDLGAIDGISFAPGRASELLKQGDLLERLDQLEN